MGTAQSCPVFRSVMPRFQRFGEVMLDIPNPPPGVRPPQPLFHRLVELALIAFKGPAHSLPRPA